ncbi:hypothetical protein SLEP1_g32234 [Rubroshorea leprosula]|uniref:Uncharacterized protein n=1 Tax=Rubroshorea leprosula TaxID=152421 RepID=A0AAV5KCL7_9ROSI|nr:hypothetical protein SLEP1_g32234 [Rubroshorea leprosula]
MGSSCELSGGYDPRIGTLSLLFAFPDNPKRKSYQIDFHQRFKSAE